MRIRKELSKQASDSIHYNQVRFALANLWPSIIFSCKEHYSIIRTNHEVKKNKKIDYIRK